MAGSHRDLWRQPEADRLLCRVEVLLRRDSQRQRRVDAFDARRDEPAWRERLRPLHVPSARRAMAKACFEGIVHPFSGEACMSKRQLRFNGRDRCVTILGDRWTLAGAHPPAACDRCTYSETHEWRHACADDDVREAGRSASSVARTEPKQAQW